MEGNNSLYTLQQVYRDYNIVTEANRSLFNELTAALEAVRRLDQEKITQARQFEARLRDLEAQVARYQELCQGLLAERCQGVGLGVRALVAAELAGMNK